MRLGSLRRDGSDGRDGSLVVVSRDGARCLPAQEVAPTLQAALDDWEVAAPGLRALAARLERDGAAGAPLDPAALAAPLPRVYEWLDGSAFLSHVRLVRRSRGVEPPADL